MLVTLCQTAEVSWLIQRLEPRVSPRKVNNEFRQIIRERGMICLLRDPHFPNDQQKTDRVAVSQDALKHHRSDDQQFFHKIVIRGEIGLNHYDTES